MNDNILHISSADMWCCTRNRAITVAVLCCLVTVLPLIAAANGGEGVERAPAGRRMYFGDLHVHTRYSPDAHSFGAIGLPDDAYLYGKGETIDHANGQKIQIGRALDFMAVTDHASYMGALIRMSEPDSNLSKIQLARDLFSDDAERVSRAVDKLKRSAFAGEPIPELVADEVVMTMWQRIVEAAERHNEPGKFTTFIGYEWSATPDNANLHRNVIFSGGASSAPDRPLSAFETQETEALWSWIEVLRRLGNDAIAIPHNPNLSDGRMFAMEDFHTHESRAHAARRILNEPIVEMSQIKGTSETHPELSPDDEWADFELLGELMGMSAKPGRVSGSYVREAYRHGLEIESAIGVNPFSFGMIGSSDSHNASSPIEEFNYTGKIGRGDGNPVARRDGGSITTENIRYSAAGLAGVWAEENTRESLFAAFRRKEVFASSGPRIELRFFAAESFSDSSGSLKDLVKAAYADGVSMGGRITAGSRSPEFLISGRSDPTSGKLERLQIVKGWHDGSETHETVYDVACADGNAPAQETHRCLLDSAEIDTSTCAAPDVGLTQLTTIWTDPEFNPVQAAFYYARVIEVPSCRWSTWDALREGWEPSEKVPATIQERAWSTPIWIDPNPSSDANQISPKG